MRQHPVYHAIADCNRRRLLSKLLDQNGQTLGELCRHLDMSRQAVSKHLAALERACLVVPVRAGREKCHYLNPVPLQAVADQWLNKFLRARRLLMRDLSRAMR
jgi:predicted transcriptional regulator